MSPLPLEILNRRPPPANGVVRWRSGSPGCDQFVTNGHWVESATANGVTVQVALEDTSWKLRAIIAVSNNGRKTIEVLSNLVTLDELAPGLKPLFRSDPLKLSHVVNHQLLLSEANAEPPRGAITLGKVNTGGLTPARSPPQSFLSLSALSLGTSDTTGTASAALVLSLRLRRFCRITRTRASPATCGHPRTRQSSTPRP